MNEPKIQQIGEPPKIDFESTNINKQLTRKIRENILSGDWPAESPAEEKMLREFKGSKLSVNKFLKNYTR